MESLAQLFELFLPFLDSLPGVRVVIGFGVVFFLPGFAWSLVFFRRQHLNIIERLALSFGLSLALVVLSILGLNIVLGVRITGVNSAMIILTLTGIPFVYCGWRWLRDRQGGGRGE